MLAVPAQPFEHSDYLFEIKWDGYRGLAFLDRQTTLLSRNRLDLTAQFPELQALHLQVGDKPVVLDGEIVVFQNGKPSFSHLQARGKTTNPLQIDRLARQLPATLVVFDILFRSGTSVMALPLRERKQILEHIIQPGPHIIVSQYIIGAGLAFYEAVTKAGLEGVMAKRLDSTYQPGKRSSAWKKIRFMRSADLVIGGWEKGTGMRRLGALILLEYRDGNWVYTGKVGTGFTREEEKKLLELLGALTVPQPVFKPPAGQLQKTVWVRPVLVCEVTYSEISPEGRLRHPCYKALRTDKPPQECRIE
ncbi:non-homologous end-joining DNA ligase [Desulfotomaculum varum]